MLIGGSDYDKAPKVFRSTFSGLLISRNQEQYGGRKCFTGPNDTSATCRNVVTIQIKHTDGNHTRVTAVRRLLCTFVVYLTTISPSAIQKFKDI